MSVPRSAEQDISHEGDHLPLGGCAVQLLQQGCHAPGLQEVEEVIQLRTGDAHLGSLLVAFYDGNPQQGGTIFDIQTIPHLRPNTIYQSRVFFRPQTCGARNIFVVAGPATTAPAAAHTMVDVTIDAVEAVEALIVSTTCLKVPRQVQAQLVTKLAVAKDAVEHNFPRVAVNRLTAFIVRSRCNVALG
jgi:hypothetical protein